MDVKVAIAVVMAMLSAMPVAVAQSLDIRNKTIVVTGTGNTNYFYVSPAGRIFSTSRANAGIGDQYELGKTLRYSTAGTVWSQKGTCKFETRAQLSGNTLLLNLLSVVCNGRSFNIRGGVFAIEINGDDCKAAVGFGSDQTTCKIVSGRSFPATMTR